MLLRGLLNVVLLPAVLIAALPMAESAAARALGSPDAGRSVITSTREALIVTTPDEGGLDKADLSPTVVLADPLGHADAEFGALGYVLTTIWLSRDDVERMWNVLQVTGGVCDFLPLPYYGGPLCGAGSAIAEAVSSAHHQKKRIKAIFHDCGFNYCNYYTYEVAA